MQREIEIKTHLTTQKKNSLVQYFNNLYNTAECEYKADAYFKDAQGEMYRLRKQNNLLIYTKKNNSISNGVEINSEQEKLLSEDEFNDLFKKDALCITKIKEGYIWSTKDIYGYDMNIEIVNVSGQSINKEKKDLGWFLETEVVAPFDISMHICNSIKNELLNFVKVLSVDNMIENRKYITMIEGK